MKEEPFFFKNGDYQLFGMMHFPMAENATEGFVFCHPFAEEKLWAHRVYVNFARELASRGFPVLRFDFMGHGDSEGEFENSSIETNLSDIAAAIKTIHVKNPSLKKVSLMGLRFGATLAVSTAINSTNINRLILWDPIVDGNSYMQEMLRINLTTQMATYKKVIHNREALIEMMKNGEPVDIDGYQVSYEYFQQASKVKLLENDWQHAGKSLIVQIGKPEQPVKPDIGKLASHFTGCDIKKAHEYQFWKEIKIYYDRAANLFTETLSWIDN